jgi:hypothetical protein
MDRRVRAAAAAEDGHVLVVGDGLGVGTNPYLRFPAATD